MFEFPDMFPQTAPTEVDEPDDKLNDEKSLVEKTREAANSGNWFSIWMQ